MEHIIDLKDKAMHQIIDDVVEEALSVSSFTGSTSKRPSNEEPDSASNPPIMTPTPSPVLRALPVLSAADINAIKPIMPKPKPKMIRLHANNNIPIDTIHQIWFSGLDDLKENEEALYENVERYKTVNGGKYLLWSEKEIQSLVIQEYDEDALKKYIALEGYVDKIQYAKYLILHHYGGFYVDMNTECKQSFAGLVNLAKTHGNKPLVCKLRKDPLMPQITAAVINKVVGDQFFYFTSRKHEFAAIMLEMMQNNDKAMVVDTSFVTNCIKEWMKRIKEKDKHVMIEQSLYLTVVETDYISEYFEYQVPAASHCNIM